MLVFLAVDLQPDIAKAVATSAASARYLCFNAKMEVYALEAYRDALHNCLSLIDNLYFTGELPSNLEEFKHIVSLYLGIMERSNELSIKVANSISNSIFPDYERDEDLAQLQEQLAFIRELQALYTN